MNKDNIQVIRYTSGLKQDWDDFVSRSKNSSFLFFRDYMDYHADRFSDHSLLVYKGRRLCALLPANESGASLISHGGLSYGGLLLPVEVRLPEVLAYFYHLTAYLAERGFYTLVYKSIPLFYHRYPAFEEAYALFLLGARLFRTDTNLVIDRLCRLPYQQQRRRAVQKARKAGLEVRQTQDLAQFWRQVLTPNLNRKYGLSPVHSLPEIEQLARRFPQQLVFYGSYLGGQLLAGTLLYLNAPVVHAQYIAASAEGRRLGAGDLLFYQLIEEEFVQWRYFSFGISTDNQGKSLNRGLSDWKEGFGASSFVHQFYEVDTRNFFKLKV